MAEQGSSSKKATFAGGCFWCMQPPFRAIDGVIDVVSGYAGGTKENPTYAEVSAGTTGHLEAVQVTYDPERVSYEHLLDTFWHQIDPTDPSGQFADKGPQYHTAIFYHDEDQKRLAEESKRRIDASRTFARPVMTEIRPYTNFYPAEDYHQDYDRKNPQRYHQYKILSGREPFIRKMWGEKHAVTIYATPGCSGCRAAKKFLDSMNVRYTEVDLAGDEAARNLVREKTGYIGSPVIRIGDVFIAGFDRKKIEETLRQ